MAPISVKMVNIVSQASTFHASPQLTLSSILHGGGTSLVAKWLRNRLRMQGTRVRALVREDPTCRGAAKPVSHNY